MRILDEKFKHNVSGYLFQCFAATVIIFVVLLFIDTVFSMTIVASLGASTFIAFTMPHINASRPRYLIGGYVVGAVCGIAMNCLNNFFVSADVQLLGHSPHILTCAFAVGAAILLMTLLNFEHPPAAALAMGLVMDSKVFITSLIAVASIAVISLLKTLLKKWFIDLL